jgi:hypothetical protein
MSAVPMTRTQLGTSWRTFEAWVGTRRSVAALFVLALAVFALQSVVLPVQPGRDMGRYVQTFVQYWNADPVLPAVLNTRGPLAALGVGVPLELGGVAAEIWLALLYAGSIVAWGAVAYAFGARAAIVTTGLLLVYPGYGILFHGLASDALFAAAFAGWALVLSRALLRPSIAAFLATGAGMGLLVLVRPANQVLIVLALLPVLLRASWGRRMQWIAAFFVASAIVTQGWKLLMSLRYGDAVAVRPSGAVLVAALVLLPFLAPRAWRRRLALVAVPVAVVALVAVVVRGELRSPWHYARSAVQSPPAAVFLYRAFELEPIVSPGNGPASRQLAGVVERELLTQEPYRSYGVDLDEFFSSGSDRIFVDLATLGGKADLSEVTAEAIREHPATFAGGIARTVWEQLWLRRVYALLPAEGDPAGEEERATVTVGGLDLPAPTEGEPIPASRTGPRIWTLYGDAGEVWRSPTEHPLVFEDPRDERRYVQFDEDTNELSGRIPTRDANAEVVRRWNQASKAYPPPVLWLVVGLVALAWRRPRRALVALAPAAAGLIVIVGTSLVAPSVAEYAVPVVPAFILLAAAGLFGVRSPVEPCAASS